MNIEIKGLKVAEFASEETLCMNASVWIDGKRSIQISNAGHGGMTETNPASPYGRAPNEKEWAAYKEGMKKLADHVASLPPYEYMGKTLTRSVDAFLDDLVYDHQIRLAYRKLAAKSIVLFKDGACYEVGLRRAKKVTPEIIELAKKANPEHTVLNDLDEDKAFELYKEATTGEDE